MVVIALANEKVAATPPHVFSGSVGAGLRCPLRSGSFTARNLRRQDRNITYFLLSTQPPGHKGSQAVVICEVLVGRELG